MLQLLQQVREWIEEGISNVRFGTQWARDLRQFLEDNVPEWVRVTALVCLSEAQRMLESLKRVILETFRENEALLKCMLKLGTKSLIKAGCVIAANHGVRAGVKTTLKTTAKNAFKTTAKTAIKKTAKTVLKTTAGTTLKTTAKTTLKTTAGTALKTTVKTALKTAPNLVGVGSDLAQAGLEHAGYERVGKKVGAVGNMAGGAITGCMIAGPVGAGIGAVVGGSIWFAGEVVGKLL